MRKIYFEKRCISICRNDEEVLSDPNSVEFHVGDKIDIHALVGLFEASATLSRIYIPTDDVDGTYSRVCSEFKEVNLFLRGLVPMIGMKSDKVYYKRGERFAGESKYPLRKMLSFAWEGVSSLTVSPLRLITRIGIVMFLVSIAMLIYFLVRYFTGHTVAGWSSLAVSIWAIGGLQLLAIGVVGEYIGKYLETKARPRYRIETELDDREAEL